MKLSDLKGPVQIEGASAPADPAAPLRLSDLRGDVQVEAPPAPGVVRTLFPSAAAAFDTPDDEDLEPADDVDPMQAMASYGMMGMMGGPGAVGAMNPQGVNAQLGALADIASMEQRVFGKLARVSDFGDPAGGYFKGARQRIARDNEADIEGVMGSDLPDWLKRAAVIGLKTGGFAGEAAMNMAESPISTLATLGTGAVAKTAKSAPGLKKGALRFGSLDHAEEAVARAASPQGRQELAEAAMKESPDVMAAEVRGAVDGVRNTTQAELDNAILGATTGRKEPYARGESLYDALVKGKEIAGTKFQAEQDRLLKGAGVGKGKIPADELDYLYGKGDQKSFSKAMNKAIRGTAHQENAAQRQVTEILKEIQYSPKKGYGVIGNRVIGKDGISVLKRLHGEFGSAKTTQDVLNLRRLLDNEINFGGKEGRRLFVKGSDDDFVMTSLRNRLNQVVEEQFARVIKDPVKARSMAEAWRARNAFYSDVIGTMEDISKGLPAAKQNYISALEKMDVGNLKKVMQAAQEHPRELGQVAEEIRGGVVDGFLTRAMKDGKIDFKAAKKSWEEIDPELRRAMFTTNQRRDIDFALKKFSADDARGVADKRLGKYLSDDEKTVSDKLGNAANADKRYVIKELEFLDALQGRKGKDSFAYRARAMSQARQLGMDANGKIPLLSGERTGKFIAGPAGASGAGAAVGGAVAGPFGAALGSLLGLGGGAVAQSPWGIVQIYRTLDKLQKIEGPARRANYVTKRAGMAKAAASALRDDEE